MPLGEFILEVSIHIRTADFLDQAIAAHTEKPDRHFPG